MGLAGRLRVLSVALLLAALAVTWAGPGAASAARKAKCPVTKAAKRAARPHKKAKHHTEAKHHKKANSRKKKRCKRAVAGTRPAAPPLPLPLPPAVPPAGSVPTATPGIPPERFFAADSVWNAPLSPGAPLDPTSEMRTAAFRADIARQMTERIGPWIEERSNSTPIYVVGPDQPRSPVRIDRGGARLALAL